MEMFLIGKKPLPFRSKEVFVMDIYPYSSHRAYDRILYQKKKIVSYLFYNIK